MIYIFCSHEGLEKKWRGRCVTWSEEVAVSLGRRYPDQWIPDPGVYTGEKSEVLYKTVIISARTAEEPGSSSVGPFQVIICKNSVFCQDRSPITLTPTTCQMQANCMSEGITAHFTTVVAVHSSFELHAVRIVGHTEDTWTVDRLVVHIEGQVGTHHGRIGLSSRKVFEFTVGCLTTSEDFTATAQAGMPCKTPCKKGAGTYGWCYTDNEQKGVPPEKRQWGTCNRACVTSGPGTPGAKMYKPLPRGNPGMRSGMSCAELNWPTISRYNQDRAVCGASNYRPLRGCSGPVTWLAAKDFCEGAGARLCTREEIEADEAAGTGCDVDEHYTWSSTPCGEEGYMTLAGSSEIRKILNSFCSLPEDSAQAACCADSRIIEITFDRNHRDLHILPSRMHIKNSGGLANWEVIHGINRFGKQGFFLQSGMSDDQAPFDGEQLEVFITNVPIAQRGGEIEFWFKIDSEAHADRLHFKIDGKEMTTSGFPVSGHLDWKVAVFAFPAEERQEVHNFSWVYRKDRSGSVGADIACIDDITIFGVVGFE